MTFFFDSLIPNIMVAVDLAPSKLDPDLNLGIVESNITYFFWFAKG